MNEQDVHQRQTPPQQQQQEQQHKERDILGQLQETHGARPGTRQVANDAKQPANGLLNTYTDIALERLNSPDLGGLHVRFGCDQSYTDLFGISSSMPNSSSGLVLGGANHFSSPAGPYEPFVPWIQDYASAGPPETENIQPQLNFVSAEPQGFSLPNTVSNPAHPFPRDNGPRSPHLPNPPPSQQSQPLRVLQQARSPRPQTSYDNRCPRCDHLFTSKPRDLSRNIRRHLLFSCPKREAVAPRLSCSVLGCGKTFVRDCAKRVHEEKQHGIVRGRRRRAGRSSIEGLPIRRAPSVVNTEEDVARQTPIQSNVLNEVQSPSQEDSRPIDSSSIESQSRSLHDQAKMGDTRSQQSDTAESPLVHESMAFASSSNGLRGSLAVSITDPQPSSPAKPQRTPKKTAIDDPSSPPLHSSPKKMFRLNAKGRFSPPPSNETTEEPPTFTNQRKTRSRANKKAPKQLIVKISYVTNDERAVQIAENIDDILAGARRAPARGAPVPSKEEYGRALKGVKAQGLMSAVDSNVKDSGYVSATNATRAAPVYCEEREPEVERIDQEEIFDNAATVVTHGTELNLPRKTKGYFIQQFAEELLTAISPAPAPAESADRIFKALPSLLKQYALRLTTQAQSQNEKYAVAFVQQNQAYIAVALQKRWCEYQESTQRNPFPDENHAEMSWEDRVNEWNRADSADIAQSKELSKSLPEAYDGDEASTLPDLSLYKPHLLGGEAYRWLISRLRTEFLLARPEAFAMEQISEAILQQFPQSEEASMSFHLDWSLPAFFDEQGYKENFADEIPRAITITGSSSSAQATSCERYLLDIWPTTGPLTLMALQRAISERKDDSPADALEVSNLRILLRGTHTEVEIMGDKDFITDVGEQLGWMGAALRSSKVDSQMCYCVPSVTFSNGIFTIGYSSELVISTETILNGNCWHPLFNNPPIVRGFPIATRRTESPDEEVPGLEIPLNMMAGVAEAKRVTEIDGRLLIKGFSTLLIPTKRVGDLVIWHMLYNEDDSRISYFDSRGIDISDISVEGLTFPALESSRHILGWCSVARNLTGSKHAQYDIKTSGLSQPGQGWTFEKVSISGGKIINGGVTFGKGNTNIPLHLRRQPVYVKQIYEASCKHVIFYDVGDKRAWLVNGAAALLHIARAYLVFASKHPFLSTMTKFRMEDLWGPDDEYETSAPFRILCNSTNMDLVIYEDWKAANEAVIDAEGNFVETAKVKDAHFRFRDQVDEIYHIWEQIQEFQTKMTDNIRLTDRDKLQGFNFMDVATGESPIKPRFTYLERSGRGWVDLARSLDAITLFGRGFGELLQPSSASNKLCHSWSHVPTGKDYLAVSMSDVSAIFDKRGNATSRPMELVDGLFWHKADKLFEPCECADAGSRKRRFILGRGTMCDRVQVLLPPSLGRKVDPGALEEKGAVIFGRSERFRWHWPNQGQPNETTGSDEDSESERPQKKARSSPSSQGSQVSEVFSGDTQQTSATSVSGDASSSSRTETPVKK